MHSLVSIILPSYNRAKYIVQTIESCIAQTYTNFELIIVDDCSSDNSIDIIKSYITKDSRIQLIQNQHNKKLPATLNAGFAAAQGKYYTWISDDNLFESNALEGMVKALEVNQDIGLVYANYTTIDQFDKKIARITQEPPEYLPIRDCVGACFLYRADIAKKVGIYNEELFLIEDYEYWLRFGLEAKLMHLRESLYLYRIHGGSLTQSRKNEIRLAKNHLKKKFANKYMVPKNLEPIAKLYDWFISDRTVGDYIGLFKTIIYHPYTTCSYIITHFKRMK